MPTLPRKLRCRTQFEKPALGVSRLVDRVDDQGAVGIQDPKGPDRAIECVNRIFTFRRLQGAE